MKKIFLISTILFAIAGMITGNYQITAIAFVGAFALTGKTKTNVLASVGLIPAVIVNPKTGEEIPPFTRAQKALWDWLRVNGNAITQKALAEGKLIWNPVTYYIRASVFNANGRTKIMGSSTTKLVGICNLDKGMLQQFYNFCYDRIAVRYATAAVATDALTPLTLPGYSSVRSSMPAGLASGELIISLNKQVQLETPISDFTSNAAITGGGSRDFDGGELQVPKVWQENLQIDAEINFASNMPSTVNNSYCVEIQFYGVEARLG